MSGFRDRHLVGAGAAACAVCCAPPLLALLGVAGLAATAVTFVFAGTVFALVVAGAAGLALTRRRKAVRAASCTPSAPGPVDVTLTTAPPGHEAQGG